ncbi:MAG: glycosyltransferase family 2 protein [Chloroflexi bacterium]|nr:glycosyltransferase family 2 protein [Chloroflexota bacterium]
MDDLAIIIVSHNSKEFLPACLNTVREAIEGLTATVFVVDNGGSDGAAEFVRQDHAWCEAIESRVNGGYSFGNNLGLKAAGFPESPRFRYVMLLNPDTETPPDAFRKMIAYMDSRPGIGVLGPRLALANGSLDLACRRGEPTPATSFYHIFGLAKLFPHSPRFARYNMTFLPEHETADVDSVVGACMLLRGEALVKVGLMDERFFMYAEDIDLNLRIKQHGYRVVYWPEVTVKHLKGTSTRKQPERMIRSFYETMAVFHRKHYASRYPAPFNGLVYAAIGLVCRYKLLRNRLTPPDKRVVGSAKA